MGVFASSFKEKIILRFNGSYGVACLMPATIRTVSGSWDAADAFTVHTA